MQLLPDPPCSVRGAIAQLGERLVCNQKVAGSIPAGSTNLPARCRLIGRPIDARSRDDPSPSEISVVGLRDRAMPVRHRVLFNNPECFLF